MPSERLSAAGVAGPARLLQTDIFFSPGPSTSRRIRTTMSTTTIAATVTTTLHRPSAIMLLLIVMVSHPLSQPRQHVFVRALLCCAMHLRCLH